LWCGGGWKTLVNYRSSTAAYRAGRGGAIRFGCCAARPRGRVFALSFLLRRRRRRRRT